MSAEGPVFRSNDEEFFDQNPNAARFRDLARQMLQEAGATKESVRKELQGYGADEEVLDRILRTPQIENPQQQAQANAGEAAGADREKILREKGLELIAAREKGNKGTRILQELKRLGYSDDDIKKIDEAGGEVAKRPAKAERKPDRRVVDVESPGSPMGKLLKQFEEPTETVGSTEKPPVGAATSETEGRQEMDRRIFWQTAEKIVHQRRQGVSDQDIEDRLKKAGWKETDIPDVVNAADVKQHQWFLEDASSLPEHFERPEFEMAKRYLDPLRKFLFQLGEKKENGFRIKEARPRYFVGVRPEKADEKTKWDKPVTNYHDFLRLLYAHYHVPGERKRLVSNIAVDDGFLKRLEDPKDALHPYRGEWEALRQSVLKPKSERERFPDDYALAARRGDAYLEVPEENWDELATNADVLESSAPSEPGSTDVFDASPAGIEVYESDLLNDAASYTDQFDEAGEHIAIDPVAAAKETEEQAAIDQRIAETHALSDDEEELFAVDMDEGDTIPEPPPGLSAEERRQWLVDRELDLYRATGWQQDMPAVEDKTRFEWQRTLRSLIERARDVSSGMSERGERLKSYLDSRAKDLDAHAGEMGWTEKTFRKMGEGYDKLSFVHKLGIGFGLGVGAAISAPVSITIALAFTGALAGQRAFGMASMFLKIEKDLKDRDLGSQVMAKKERAMLGAMLYTAAVGTAIKEGVELASHTQLAEFLRTHWPFGHTVAPTRAPEHPASAPVHNESAPMAAASTPEHAAAPAPVTEAQPASEAGPGRGFVNPANVVPDRSEAAPEAGAGRGFVNPADVIPDGSEPASEAGAGRGFVHPAFIAETNAPNAAMESSIPPEAAKINVPASKGHGAEYMMKRFWEQLQEKGVKLPENADQDSDLYKLMHADKGTIDSVVHKIAMDQNHNLYHADGTSVLITPESHMTLDSHGNISLSNIDADKVTPTYHPEASIEGNSPEATAAVEAHRAEVAAAAAQPTPEHYENFGPGEQPQDAMPGAEQASAPVTNYDFVVNSHDVTVRVAEPHFYAGPPGMKEVLVYGGDMQARRDAIFSYLTKHPGETVVAADDTGKYRALWSLTGDKKMIAEPVRRTGLAAFFGGTFFPPPSPEELTQVVQ